MNIYDRIKRLAVIAIFSQDYLMEKLVLKGGNALDLIYNQIYKTTLRSSLDLDFSMEQDFKKEELKIIEDKIKINIENTFKEHNYEVFDFEFTERPQKRRFDSPDFWGGYCIEFKVIEKEKFKQFVYDLASLRRNAITIDDAQRRKVKIDISKFEYCSFKKEMDVDGYTIYIYTIEAILFEKIRAICQQMPEYTEEIGKTKTPRARDFFDIYTINEKFKVDFDQKDNKKLIGCIFEAKKVPLILIKNISRHRDFHKQDFASVRDTVTGEIKDFDFYFDYVIKIGEKILHSLGIV